MFEFLDKADPVLYYLGLTGLAKYVLSYKWKDVRPKDAELAGHVQNLRLYPFKSAHGIDVSEMLCSSEKTVTCGSITDRHWMVTRSDYDMVSSRQEPKVSMIRVRMDGAKLILSAPGLDDELVLDPDLVEKRRQIVDTNVHTVPTNGLDAGEGAADWMSRFLGKPNGFRIVYCGSDIYRRGVIGGNKKYLAWTKIAKPEDKLAFHDSISMHMLAVESVADLNKRLPDPIDVHRFRPNVVLSTGSAPYDEDNWKHVYIGDAKLKTLKLCARCILPNVDPLKGEELKEPLKTLNTYRNFLPSPLGPALGIDLIVEKAGVIREGDPIYVIRGDNLAKP